MAYKRSKMYGGKTYSVNKTTHTNGKQRITSTQKQGNYKISTSRNSNGTIRRTTTHKGPGGFIHRKTQTFGSTPRPKKYRPPKQTTYKSSSSRRRSYRSNNDAEISLAFIGAFFAAIWWAIVSSFKAIGFIYKTIAALTEPRESRIKFHAIVTLKFIGLIYMIALISYAIWSFQ
jgi:hypothetical protein